MDLVLFLCHSGPDFHRDKLQPESRGIKEGVDVYTILALFVSVI